MTESYKKLLSKYNHNSLTKKKEVAIMFSGGLDSMFLLDYAISMGYGVTLIYTDIGNNKEKGKRELAAIDSVISYYENDKNSFRHIRFIKNKIELDIRDDNYNIIFSQIPINILSSLTSCEGCDEIWFGYVMGDQAISYIDDIKCIYRGYNSIYGILNKSLPSIKFPLIKVSKLEIVDNINNDLLSFVTFCESGIDFNDNNERCGECESCKRYDYEFRNRHYITNFAHLNNTKSKNKKMVLVNEDECNKMLED